ncbi:GcvT family protein [Roseovarius indicus]|uniref:GcvT family protein n=1 Tax=Roseovarius indicus TaxID=540747 RepID=UPI0007D9C4D3|nr:FAD-dependent oxidoreductase [Roseovarius indicus]OAO07117.1 oxidoreductase [Roseovarius indicus]
MPTTSETRGIVIIGGGAVGLSLAYHLARLGAEDVLLLERNQLTSGTSWHAAGIVGPLRATPNMTRLAMYAGELFPRLEQETGLSTGYRVTGGYWLAKLPERMDELHRIAALGRHFGLSPEMVTTDELGSALPCLSTNHLHGVMAVAQDASVNPVDLCMAYARAARSMGVEIRENTGVARLLTEGGRVYGVGLEDDTEIRAGQVALCCGAWSKRLAETANVALPLQPVEHMYVVTEPRPEFEGFPVLRDLDSGVYIKGDTGKLVIGGFEPDAKCWNPDGPEGNRPFLELPEDWDQFTPFMEAALELIPSLENTGIQHFMNGPESFTADTRPLIGAAPEVDGLYVAAGMNSVGVMSSAGVGRLLAGWMQDGQPPMDAWEVDIARVDPLSADPAHMATRMKEAVADLFTLHWPYKQPKAGRDLRRSALHDHWQAQGAVFGLTAGWERGLWYAESEQERALPYSIGDQPWWPIATREAARMETGTVLLDLSPFTKLRVEGRDALKQLNSLCPAQLDVNEDRAVYTQFLNAKGGIEVEATVTRPGPEMVEITTGAATRWRDRAFFRRALDGVALTDITEEFCVIGVMGAGSRDTLRGMAQDWPDMPFGHTRTVTVAGVETIATRLSFVGELGWELRVRNEDAPALIDALTGTGATPMGHYALDGCRIEKGFVHWGHDIGPEITPLEAGLGFNIDWSKDFTGKAALEAQLEGLSRRLVLCEVEGSPLVLHDEPVWENGRVVGLTTSGARGPRTGLTLAFTLVEVTKTPMKYRHFEIEIAGERYRATPLTQPPYDPKGKRMRA